MDIRNATEADLPAVYEFIKCTAVENKCFHRFLIDMNTLKNLFHSTDVKVFIRVLEDNDKIIGMSFSSVGGVYALTGIYDLYIGNVYLIPEKRHFRNLKMLVSDLIHIAQETNASGLSWFARKENKRIIRKYKKIGGSEFKEQSLFYIGIPKAIKVFNTK